MSAPNGHHPGHAPLDMKPAQRTACLRKLGLENGWLLLSLAEMMELRRTMHGATAENQRLNQQGAELIARWIADQGKAVAALNRMAKFCEGLAARQDLPMVMVADALNELSAIQADLAHFKAANATATGSQPKEGA